MSCVSTEPRFATGWILTLWYLLLMTLVTGGLLLAGDHLLGKRLLEKDQQLVSTLMDNYQRVGQDAGPDKLLHVLHRDREFLQLSHYRLRFDTPDGRRLFTAGSSLPEPGAGLLDDGSWSQQMVIGDHRLHIALDAGPRQQDLARYRLTMLQLMLPMLLFSLLLVAWLTHSTLRPIQNLILRVAGLQRDGLEQAVPLTASPRSELGRLTLLFNQQMSRIHRLVCGLRHALDSAAHDLRTPLTRQRLSLEQALSSDDAAQWRESLLDCAEENQRMEALLGYLLAITAAEQGLDPAHERDCELDGILRDTVDLYNMAAEDKGVQLTTDIDGDLRLRGDAQALRQAFANLLDNALKYTPAGGSIRLQAHRQGDKIRVRLTDSGIGIDPADLPHVFERLYRADSSRQSPGHGLGLTLVKAILDNHRARITVDSDQSGTRIECRFPIG